MDTSLSRIQEKLSCPVCYEQFQDDDDLVPVVLDCGHSLCKRCATATYKNEYILCPYCRHKTEVRFSSMH